MFNKINNITNRKIIDNFNSLESLVNYIRTDQREEIDHIYEARKHGKGTDVYNKIKTTHIPCAIINFNHSNYVNSKSITTPTGYMYVDVDGEESMDIDFSYTCAYWKSLSNNGYSLIFKVNGLTPENLKDAYRYVGSLVDINYDLAAISKDRVTVLSYDPNAYFCNDVKEIDLSLVKSTQHNIKKNIYLGYDCNRTNICYDNLDLMIEQSGIDIVYDENGFFDFGANNKIFYSKIQIPFKPITTGKRNIIMSCIAHQLIALNKNQSKNLIFSLISSINKDKMRPPLSSIEINSIVNKKFQNRKQLAPMLNATRRFMYDPNFNLSATQKRKLNIKKISHDKIERSKAKISEALLSWDYKKNGKITIVKLTNICKMNRKTIQKYYTSLLEELKISKTKLVCDLQAT